MRCVRYAVHRVGYVVRVLEEGRIIYEYSAGNSPSDSQVYVAAGDGLPESVLREYARQTAEELAREFGAGTLFIEEEEEDL